MILWQNYTLRNLKSLRSENKGVYERFEISFYFFFEEEEEEKEKIKRGVPDVFFSEERKKGVFFSKEVTFILTLYILYIYFRGSKKPVLSRVCEAIHDKKVRDT